MTPAEQAAYNLGFACGSGDEGAYQREIAQLKSTLSLAEEGLANAMQELGELKKGHEQYVDYASPQLERLGREMAENERLRQYEPLKGGVPVREFVLQQALAEIRQESLTCAMACPHSCDACERLYSVIRRAVPQPPITTAV